jgi:DNA/RNA endonuclease YhcR with UshA esterase domain
MTQRPFIAATLASAALLATAVEAHHSWSAIYKADESTTIEGVVTEFLFRSPHLALVLDVQNDAGEAEQWTVEWGSPRRHLGAGYTPDVFQPGDRVTVTGEPAWTPGRKSVRMRTLLRASDGFTLSGGRSRRQL